MSVLRYFITSKAKRNLLKFLFSNDGAYYTREVARLTGEPLNAVRRELGYLEKAGLLRTYMQGNQKYYQVVDSYPLLNEWKKIILTTDDTAVTPAKAVRTTSKKPAAPTEEGRPKHYADVDPIIPGAEVVMDYHPDPAEPEELPPLTAITAESTEEHKPAGEGTAFTVSSFVDFLKGRFDDISSIALAVVHGDATRSEEIPAAGVDLLVVGDINKDALLEMVANIGDTTGIGINLTRMTRSDFDYRNAQGDPLMRRMWGEKKLVIKGRH